MKGHENSKNNPWVYSIRVKGKLDETWSGWFDGLDIYLASEEPSVTVITGVIIDQAKLRSILNKLWDLNLTLLSVNQSE